MAVWDKVAGQRKSGRERPLQGARVIAPHVTTTSTLGAVPRLEDEAVRPTEMRGAKLDGRRKPRTGRLYQMNIRANEAIVRAFDADAEKLGFTRGAFFEKCYHAFKAGQGDKKAAFLLQAMSTLELIARYESKERGQVVTPETLLKNMFADRMDLVGMPRGKS
jgi:hypothetical protein